MALQFNLSDGNASTLAQIEGDPGAVKLDADFYHVDDIHGVTEGLTGSGNLNYLVLQARQTDEARALFNHLLAMRSDLGLLAEEYDPRHRRLVGNFPQAFSHIGLVNTAYNLAPEQVGPAEIRGVA